MKRMLALATAAVLTLTGCDLGLAAEPVADDGPPDAVVCEVWAEQSRDRAAYVHSRSAPSGRCLALAVHLTAHAAVVPRGEN